MKISFLKNAAILFCILFESEASPTLVKSGLKNICSVAPEAALQLALINPVMFSRANVVCKFDSAMVLKYITENKSGLDQLARALEIIPNLIDPWTIAGIEAKILTGGFIDCFSIAQDGNSVHCLVQNTLKIFSTHDGSLLHTVTFDMPMGVRPYMRAISNSTRTSLLVGYRNCLYVCNNQTGEVDQGCLLGDDSECCIVKFSSNGTYAFFGLQNGNTKIFNIETKESFDLLERRHSNCYTGAFSADDKKIVLGFENGDVIIFDLETKRTCLQYNFENEWCRAANFSPDGTKVVLGFQNGDLILANAEKEEVFIKQRAHEGLILSVNFSADGTGIISGSSDNTVKIWSAQTGKLINQVYNGGATIQDARFYPNCENRILTMSGEGGLRNLTELKGPNPKDWLDGIRVYNAARLD